MTTNESCAAVMAISLFALNPAQVAWSEWLSMQCSIDQVDVSHMLAEPSFDEVINYLPLLLNEAHITWSM